MDVGDAWTKSDICTRIPGLVGPLLRAARLLYGDGMVSSGHRFSMLGVKGGAGIQLVLDRRYKAKCKAKGKARSKEQSPKQSKQQSKNQSKRQSNKQRKKQG